MEKKMWIGNIHNKPWEVDKIVELHNPVINNLVLPDIIDFTKQNTNLLKDED